MLSEKFIYTGTPAPEQKAIIDEISLLGYRTWLVEMKTGRGKGHIIMQLCNLFQEKMLIACHSRSNMVDTINKFKEFSGYEVWEYHWTKKKIKDITVTTHSSLTAHPEVFAGKFWILVVDECDYNLTRDMIRAISLVDVDGCFWLSWTPTTKELDLQSMELIRWPHLKVEWQDLNGYNLIPEILRLDYTSNAIYSFDWGFSNLKTELIEDNIRVLTQVMWIKKIMDEQANFWLLLLERREQECDKYYELLKDKLDCIIINGKTKLNDDEENLKKLKEKGKGLIIWTIGKIGRGKDIPMIDAVFLFFPNRYQNSTVQAVGRGLRNYPWKNKCLLVDWIDNPILKRQSYDRLRTYKQEYTDEVKITTLPIRPFNDNKTTV